MEVGAVGESGGRHDDHCRVLVVDDDTDARVALAELLKLHGFVVDTARDGFKALHKLRALAPDVLLTDLVMPGMDGVELVRRAREVDPDSVAVVLTAFGAIDSALSAMRAGAADYIMKPFRVDEFVRITGPALARRRLRRELSHVPGARLATQGDGEIVGTSPAVASLLATVMQVAESRASVLITGESGTGKELVARAIHRHSRRAGGPFVDLHCAALAETLLESELFGHERGAFTGAVNRREGRFRQADGGTLFFDEIGEIPPATQIKLLRVLQEREFERVGGNETLKVDVRVVAATNRDLRERVRAGFFREDLFYRINVVSIEVPPLRARMDDVPLLAAHFLARSAAENDRSITGFTAAAMERLLACSWPGNVRQLANAVERAVVVCRGSEIDVGDLPVEVTDGAQRAAPVVPGASMAEVERHAILSTLAHVEGSTTRAARILGISVRTIQNRLRQYRREEQHRRGRPGPAIAGPFDPRA
jgi:DNA-binding NtrC family response regulator